MVRWVSLVSLTLIWLALICLWYLSQNRVLQYSMAHPASGVGLISHHGSMRFAIRLTNRIPRWRREDIIFQPEFGYDREPTGSWLIVPSDPLAITDNWDVGADTRRWCLELVTADGVYSPLSPAGDRYLRIRFPHWFAVTITAAVLFPWMGWTLIRRRRDARRRREGRCLVCGYDIRANPQRCSECGTEQAEDRITATA